jgi:predicted DNA-binding transcriptional regulator AlpA
VIVDTSDLVTIGDIAKLANVTKQAVWNWTSRFDTFPQPVAEFSKVKVYQRHEVFEWLTSREETPRTQLRKHSEDDTVWV